MRSSLLLAALAAGAANAYVKHVYVTDWTTVTVTTTVTEPAVTETVPAAQQDQVVYQTSTAPAPVETQLSELSKKSTVIVPESVTSQAPENTPAPQTQPQPQLQGQPQPQPQPQPSSVSTSWFSTAWTSTIEPASSTLATSTSAASTASSTPANSYQQTVLYNHNIHRSNHSAPSVDWSADLESSARTLAARCVYQHDT